MGPCLFIIQNITVNFSRIRTRIVIVEGEHADHLASTTLGTRFSRFNCPLMRKHFLHTYKLLCPKVQSGLDSFSENRLILAIDTSDLLLKSLLLLLSYFLTKRICDGLVDVVGYSIGKEKRHRMYLLYY